MTIHLIFRLLLLAVFAAGIGYNLCRVDEMERQETLPNTQRRYQPYNAGTSGMLPTLMLLWLTLELLVWRSPLGKALEHLAAFSSLIFLHTILYYGVLLGLLPWLRRHISARACGFLWLVPNFLYLSFYSTIQQERPLVVLHPPTGLLPVLGRLWLVGTAAVMGWSILSHLRFRRELLAQAVPETDPAVLDIWQAEQHRAGFHKTPYPLLRSPAVRTPLSIGLIRPTIRVVLPERRYTPEELTLVLRHELVHIGRGDACSKLFLTFCTALFWFNPLMWLAMRRSAEDFELSCDETVLLDADAPTRRRYAELLLTTGGEQRGFTTCLSASAQSLRYRLRAVMAPARRSLGALVLTAAVLLLTLPFGAVTFAWNSGTAMERIFAGDPAACTVSGLSYFDAAGEQHWLETVPHPEPILEAVGALTVEELAGIYQLPTTGDPSLFLHCTIDGVTTDLTLTEDTLAVSCPHTTTPRHVYYLPQPPDWAALQALLPQT